ncbi:endoribonuclease L-psp family protein [Corynespora cassiicola Philippines]|uniref:Endoribonuclease L-psp family protein n=1 Tax=Corynespora cassiicola Philippines TaxID=1448308 RepID=A0A2T2N289_CORCC|nr:endoribonuclease L-psp family protein [Corynespora cassiicola Philippines]
MAHLQYSCYKGFGEEKREQLWYSQAVRVGDILELAGQGGWDPETSVIPTDLDDEIDRAFANVDHCLKDAGGAGWSEVYKIRLYLTDANEQAIVASVRNFKKWTPNHRPILTCVEISKLGLPGMRVEIEVKAHVANKA